MKVPTFTIGCLAKQAGVHVETIRYYQRRGLLEKPTKPSEGTRRYPVTAVERIQFIKRAQALGFTLEEIAALLRLDEACACAETRELAVRKLALIERKRADLTAMRDVLKELVRQCDAGAGKAPCPIIRSLTKS